jgi:hypothetical protein
MEEILTMRKTTAFLTILATSLVSYAAVAQDEAAPPEGAPPAAPPPEGAPPAAPAPEATPAAAPAAPAVGFEDYALRSLTLSAGTFQVTLPIVLNLSKSAVLKPVWIPLDLRYGVTNELEVFINHGVPGGFVFSESGLCLGGEKRGCPKVYNNIVVGGQYSLLKASGAEVSGILALDVREFSPDMRLAVDLGVGFKYIAAPVSVKIAPHLGIGVNKRSALGNKEILAVPLQVAFQAAPQIAVFLDSGIFGPISHFGDNYDVPVGIGADYLVQHGLDVGLEFMLPRVVSGTSGNKAMDSRALMLYAAYRTN